MNNLLKTTTATVLWTLFATSVMATDNVASPAVSTDGAIVPNQEQVQGPLQVISAIARPSMTGSKHSAAYITLHNDSTSDITITGAVATSVANHLELHTTTDEAGVKKMVKVDKLVVPAGGDLVMKKGGIHIMLMDIKKPLNAGDKFMLELRTSELGMSKVEVVVVQM